MLSLWFIQINLRGYVPQYEEVEVYARETAVSKRLGKQRQGAEGVRISLRQLAAFSE